MALILTAGKDDSGRRLDRILRKALRQTPLSTIHRMLRQGLVLVGGCKADAGHRVLSGETITVLLATEAESEIFTSVPISIRSYANGPTPVPEILFEGSGLIILNKPAGISVHGRGSLDSMVQSYLATKLPPSLSFRPGPLHRLDKPSSGVLAFSTSLDGARLFSGMMRGGMIKKKYLAIVEGRIEKAEAWEDVLFRDKKNKKTFTENQVENNPEQLKGKYAVTSISSLITNKTCSLVLFKTETGRTHQIRAQAASRGHPLLGDRKYGASHLSGGFLLHAWRLYLPPPFPPMIEAPLPENFKTTIKKLFGTNFIERISSRKDAKTQRVHSD
jgi:23S rRNA pseudouridine955/2504/2580 synthase